MKKALLSPLYCFEHCLESIISNQVDAFIAVSPAVAEIYSWYNISPKKITVIPPALDYEYISSLKHNHEPQQPSNNLYNILYVGRVSREKGIDVLIDAVSRLEFRLNLHIVGDGAYKYKLEQYSKQLGLSDKVLFHGWVPYHEVVDWYLSSQLFVHPARWPEPFGMTIPDAMALGVPVIAADSGGPPWILHDSGLTFRPGDSQDLAQKINQIQSYPLLAKDLVARAQERVKDFDYRKVLPQLLKVYTSLIETVNTR